MNVMKNMKVLILLSLVVLLLPSTFVQAKEKTLLGISTVYEERRTNIEVGVFIHTDEEIAGGSFDIVYDQNKMSVRKVDMDGQLGSLSSSNYADAGTISVAWAKAEGEALKGTLLKVTAYPGKASDTIDFKFKNVHLYAEDGSEIAVQLLDGQIKPFPLTGENNTHDSTEKIDKEWTITLSKPFDPATLNEHTVKVKSGSNLVDVDVKRKNDNSFTVTPKGNYTRGTYILEITEQLHSLNGSKLNKPVRHEFRVQ